MSVANLTVEPVVSVICPEKRGAIERNVFPMRLDQQSLQTFWTKARKFPTLFSKEINDDFTKFLSLFLEQLPDGNVEPKGLLWRIDDFVGVFYLTDIDLVALDAKCHFTFFDGRINGRVDLAKAMLKYAMEKYHFRRLSAEVPMYALPSAHSFVRWTGFKVEGRKRLASLYKNHWYDTVLYGVLNNEV